MSDKEQKLHITQVLDLIEAVMRTKDLKYTLLYSGHDNEPFVGIQSNMPMGDAANILINAGNKLIKDGLTDAKRAN